MKKYLNAGYLVAIFGLELAISTGYLIFILPNVLPSVRAAILMRLGLISLWVVAGGLVMYFLRNRIRDVFQRLKLDPRIVFVLLATLLAIVEELIATVMTNLAPVFGVQLGAAYLTASSDYLDVICFHSVVVFIPMFIGWAILLKYRAFSPCAVFLLFGLSGTIAEMLYGGSQALLDVGLWVFVYGLMVYWPAYCFSSHEAPRAPAWWEYGLAICLPLLFAIPVALVVGIVHPVRVHFPPLQSMGIR
jgi:hypothetical protein